LPVVRFGIVILADQRWQRAARRWRLAEEYGFDHAWTYDHLGWRSLVDGPWFDAVPTLTAAATVTSQIRLGTLVASPNFRHPVSFMRQLTALDDISGGRIVLGLGAGAAGASFDTKVLGEPGLSPRQRADRYGEFAELLDLLLRADHVTWSGEYYRAVDARNLPGCVQQPRIPFVMAANGPRSIALAGPYAGQECVLAAAAADVLPRRLPPATALPHEQRQGVGDAGGLLLAVDLDAHADGRERAEMSLLDVRERRLRADRRAGQHGGGEPDPVKSVVDAHGQVLDAEDLHGQDR
jgi:alkanesulfonate monooxygenase SsuD/methylene tetrahydromethanopterin reductase-like flavin-dependent oxidoreductase (luciferase family)